MKYVHHWTTRIKKISILILKEVKFFKVVEVIPGSTRSISKITFQIDIHFICVLFYVLNWKVWKFVILKFETRRNNWRAKLQAISQTFNKMKVTKEKSWFGRDESAQAA